MHDDRTCIIRKGGLGRWYIQHAKDEHLAWSGSAWVPVTDEGYFAGRGFPAGDTQVCNFSDVDDAIGYAEKYGLRLAGIVKP